MMMVNESEILNETNISDGQYEELIPSRKIQFWTILPFEIPSLICTIYLLYHLLFNRKLRQALHNHVIIILLVLTFTADIIDNPLCLDAFLHNGRSSFPPSPIICLIWLFIDYGVYGAITVFFAWASIERHILIFHYHQFLRTKLRRIIFHYIPLGIISVYMLGFYIGVIIFPPCENVFDYNLEVCGMSPCYENIPWLNIWDYFFNGTICIFIEAIFSVSLLIRVMWKRYRAQRSIHWRKHRRMTIQLLTISTLSLSITLPQTLITAVQDMTPGMDDFGSDVAPYFFYLTTYVVLLLPFVALTSFPELWPKLAQFNRCRQQAVVPFTKTTAIIRKHYTTERPRTTFQ